MGNEGKNINNVKIKSDASYFGKFCLVLHAF